MSWKTALNLLGASVWSGIVGGAIMGAGYGVLFILQASFVYEGLESPRQFMEIAPPLTFSGILASIYIFSIYGGLGALIGGVAGSLVGLLTGGLIRLAKQTDKAHLVGAFLGLIIMGFFCYQFNLLFLTPGLLIGGLGGFYSGKQFQAFFEVSV